MTAKKLIVALALLAAVSSAAFAKAPKYYDYSGAQSATGGPVFEDATHGAGVASTR
jgi:hypothetical protein